MIFYKLFREWDEDLDVMIEELHTSLTAQAENYIKSDLRNWILEVSFICDMNIRIEIGC